jgi:hypothetical protein
VVHQQDAYVFHALAVSVAVLSKDVIAVRSYAVAMSSDSMCHATKRSDRNVYAGWVSTNGTIIVKPIHSSSICSI